MHHVANAFQSSNFANNLEPKLELKSSTLLNEDTEKNSSSVKDSV